MKNILSLMVSLGVISFFSSTFAQTDMVKLIRSENYTSCGYNTGCYGVMNYLIQVKNIAYEKHVYIHQKMNDGSWIDIPAHYNSQCCNSGYEFWSLDTFPSNFGDEYVLKYVVLGQTYWDNNNGTNYHVLHDYYDGPGPMLGNDINVLLRHASRSSYDDKLWAYIDLRNIAYAKNVTLTYTTDNWQHSTSINGVYQSSYQTGYSTFIYFPNAYNVERWRVVSPGPITGPIQFYISYTVNGQTYYDNNYLCNYVINN
jgi:hypothetical protein